MTPPVALASKRRFKEKPAAADHHVGPCFEEAEHNDAEKYILSFLIWS